MRKTIRCPAQRHDFAGIPESEQLENSATAVRNIYRALANSRLCRAVRTKFNVAASFWWRALRVTVAACSRILPMLRASSRSPAPRRAASSDPIEKVLHRFRVQIYVGNCYDLDAPQSEYLSARR